MKQKIIISRNLLMRDVEYFGTIISVPENTAYVFCQGDRVIACPYKPVYEWPKLKPFASGGYKLNKALDATVVATLDGSSLYDPVMTLCKVDLSNGTSAQERV